MEYGSTKYLVHICDISETEKHATWMLHKVYITLYIGQVICLITTTSVYHTYYESSYSHKQNFFTGYD